MNKRRRHVAKQRARAQKRIVAETQRRLRNLVPVQNEYRGRGSASVEASRTLQDAVMLKAAIGYIALIFGPRR